MISGIKAYKLREVSTNITNATDLDIRNITNKTEKGENKYYRVHYRGLRKMQNEMYRRKRIILKKILKEMIYVKQKLFVMLNQRIAQSANDIVMVKETITIYFLSLKTLGTMSPTFIITLKCQKTYLYAWKSKNKC